MSSLPAPGAQEIQDSPTSGEPSQGACGRTLDCFSVRCSRGPQKEEMKELDRMIEWIEGWLEIESGRPGFKSCCHVTLGNSHQLPYLQSGDHPWPSYLRFGRRLSALQLYVSFCKILEPVGPESNPLVLKNYGTVITVPHTHYAISHLQAFALTGPHAWHISLLTSSFLNPWLPSRLPSSMEAFHSLPRC